MGEVIADLDTLTTNYFDLTRLRDALNRHAKYADAFEITPVGAKTYTTKTLSLFTNHHFARRDYEIIHSRSDSMLALLGMESEARVGTIRIDSYANNPDDPYTGVRERMVMTLNDVKSLDISSFLTKGRIEVVGPDAGGKFKRTERYGPLYLCTLNVPFALPDETFRKA